MSVEVVGHPIFDARSTGRGATVIEMVIPPRFADALMVQLYVKGWLPPLCAA